MSNLKALILVIYLSGSVSLFLDLSLAFLSLCHALTVSVPRSPPLSPLLSFSMNPLAPDRNCPPTISQNVRHDSIDMSMCSDSKCRCRTFIRLTLYEERWTGLGYYISVFCSFPFIVPVLEHRYNTIHYRTIVCHMEQFHIV